MEKVDPVLIERRLLLTGASGLLGRSIRATFLDNKWTVMGLAMNRVADGMVKLDLTNSAEVKKTITDLKPTIIIHAAAQRFPDKVEQNYDETVKLNVDATTNIAKVADSLHCPVLYISTDYVFDGKNPPFYINSVPTPLNKYGETKLAGEKAVSSTMKDHLILRIPVLYGDVEYLAESAITVLYEVLVGAKEKKVSDYEIRYPAYTKDIASICLQMAELRIKDPSLNGIFQWSGKEAMTKYEMVKQMSEVFNINCDHIIPDKSIPDGTTRPYNAQLDNSRLEKCGISFHTPFKQGIEECLKQKWN